jgi:orotidine-5'-phosphate decarboxylase
MNTIEVMRERLIVALDVPTLAEAKCLADELKGAVGAFKIGSQLFTACGPQFVRELVKEGERVFLDLKFHDIPNTVAAAAVEATRLGVFMFNVHASGGREMLLRTRDAVADVVAREELERPLVIAVTVLTSTDDEMLRLIGVNATAAEQVKRLALLTDESGLDGVVASPLEVGLIRKTVSRADFVLVTPGVRPASATHDDQKRTATPASAIAAGSDYLVIGRPVTDAADPLAAAEEIVQEMSRNSLPSN